MRGGSETVKLIGVWVGVLSLCDGRRVGGVMVSVAVLIGGWRCPLASHLLLFAKCTCFLGK